MTKKKTCSKCKEEKPVDQFHKMKATRDGLRPNCKMCQSLSAKRYREENREKKVEIQRRYYEKNRENRLEYRRRYYDENREVQKRAVRETMARSVAISNAIKTKSGRWSDDEVSELLDNYDKMTNLELALHLGRNLDSVKGKIRHLKGESVIQ